MTNPLSFLTNLPIHSSWQPFFEKTEVLQDLLNIEKNVGTDFTPATDKVLRFATVNLEETVCCVIGKDPYPQPGVATGRSFEVAGISNWLDPAVNSSLKNITKLIHKAYLKQNDEAGASIEEVRADIQNGNFALPAPHIAFSHWESQGVLFLNSAFTCQVGDFQMAGSHLKLWKPFFNKLLSYMAETNPEIRYFLWGDSKKYAKTLLRQGVREELLYTSNHPCTNGDVGGYQNGTKFLHCPCFVDTKESIRWIS